jgi:hypothetical protein
LPSRKKGDNSIKNGRSEKPNADAQLHYVSMMCSLEEVVRTRFCQFKKVDNVVKIGRSGKSNADAQLHYVSMMCTESRNNWSSSIGAVVRTRVCHVEKGRLLCQKWTEWKTKCMCATTLCVDDVYRISSKSDQYFGKRCLDKFHRTDRQTDGRTYLGE